MYIYVLDALYPHPFYLYISNQRRIHTSSYYFACDQSIFMPATKDVYISPSCTSPAANEVYIRPHKVTSYRYLVVGCIFLWLLSYIWKLLDIIEIMSNCNTNSQGRTYLSTLQGFSKPLVAEIYIEIDMLQAKEFVCARQVNTVEDIALQNKQKGRIVTVLSMHLFAGMAVYFTFFS